MKIERIRGFVDLLRQTKQICKFAFFNSVLPFLDIGTDIKAFLFYLALNSDQPHQYHPKWAILTIGWVINPFAIHVGKFFYELVTTRKAGWFELFIHVPFVQPMRNLFLTWKLYQMRFGFDDFKPKNWAKVKNYIMKTNNVIDLSRWRRSRRRWQKRGCRSPTMRAGRRVSRKLSTV